MDLSQRVRLTAVGTLGRGQYKLNFAAVPHIWYVLSSPLTFFGLTILWSSSQIKARYFFDSELKINVALHRSVAASFGSTV